MGQMGKKVYYRGRHEVVHMSVFNRGLAAAEVCMFLHVPPHTQLIKACLRDRQDKIYFLGTRWSTTS